MTCKTIVAFYARSAELHGRYNKYSSFSNPSYKCTHTANQ